MVLRMATGLVILLYISASLRAAQDPPVTVSEDASSFTLANGIVTAHIAKNTGQIISLNYRDRQLLASDPKNPPGTWLYFPDSLIENSLTINPADNGGARGEVSVKGFMHKGFLPATHGLGLEIRYALVRGDRGVYTYEAIYHPQVIFKTDNGPEIMPTEGFFALTLNGDVFNHLTASKKIDRAMPSSVDFLNGDPTNIAEARILKSGPNKGQVESKYDYDLPPIDAPAYGWSGNGLGIWIVNPSTEYISNPLAARSTCWLDEKTGLPTLGNYYSDEIIDAYRPGVASYIGRPETPGWNKVIGPFLIYCNDGTLDDALTKQKTEARAWPYDWVYKSFYPPKAARSTVLGELVVNDEPPALRWAIPDQLIPDGAAGDVIRSRQPNQPTKTPSTQPGRAMPAKNLLIGLVSSHFAVNKDVSPVQLGTLFQKPNFLEYVDYQYWVRVKEGETHFSIPNVRDGTYKMYAFADDIAGRFFVDGIVVKGGKDLNLGKAVWRPLRLGVQQWQIGSPDRSADKFLHGDDYRHWGLYLLYPKEFPHDVDFKVETGDPSKEWNYQQPPGTTWTIRFTLNYQPDVDMTAVQPDAKTGRVRYGNRGVCFLRIGTASGGLARKFFDLTINGHLHSGYGNLQRSETEKSKTYSNATNSQGTGSDSRSLNSWGNLYWIGGLNGNGLWNFDPALGADLGMYNGVDRPSDIGKSNVGPPTDTLRVVQEDNWTILRDGISGTFDDSIFAFPTEELSIGENVIQLHLPTGVSGQEKLMPYDGIIYDYLRLEIGSDTVPHDASKALPGETLHSSWTGPGNGGHLAPPPGPNPPLHITPVPKH